MRLNILLSVILLGNVAVFSVGLKWSGREDSDSEKVASANSNGGEWQVAGRRPKDIAKKLARTIYTSAVAKIQSGRQFGFLYVNKNLNENAAVLQREIVKNMPKYSKGGLPRKILDNLYVSEVSYPPGGQSEVNNYGHTERKLLEELNLNQLNCPNFVIVGTHLSPCSKCANDIIEEKNNAFSNGCDTTFYVFVGEQNSLWDWQSEKKRLEENRISVLLP